MDTTVQVAVISASASIVVAVVSLVLNKRAERRDSLQQRKLEHYRELLCAISDLAVDGTDNAEANRRFARATNTIALVAPQSVIRALMAFHQEVKFSNPNRTPAGHDEKLKKLLLEIRKSLELPFEDNPSTFHFHLVGAAPPDDTCEAPTLP